MAERPGLLELLERSWLSPIDMIGQAARATTGDLLFPAERLVKFRQQREQDERMQQQLTNLGKQRLQEHEQQRLRIGSKTYE